jgi:hypothetical protein
MDKSYALTLDQCGGNPQIGCFRKLVLLYSTMIFPPTLATHVEEEGRMATQWGLSDRDVEMVVGRNKPASERNARRMIRQTKTNKSLILILSNLQSNSHVARTSFNVMTSCFFTHPNVKYGARVPYHAHRERESAQATDTILDSDGLEDHGHTLPPVLPPPSHHFIPRMQPLLLHPIFRFHVQLNSPSPSYRTRITHTDRPSTPTPAATGLIIRKPPANNNTFSTTWKKAY